MKHSQRVSATPLKPWIAVEKVGTVLCAHCTCMAGLGEACSHIAALLFTLEANTQMKKRFSCTSLPCSWLPPSFRSVPYAPISEIDFSTSRQKRKKTCEPVSTGQDKIESSSTRDCKSQEPTACELASYYSELSKDGKPAILSVIPGFSDNYVPLSEQGVLPCPLTDLFKAEYMGLSYPDLLTKCEEYFCSITISPEQSKNIEKNTRDQACSKIWFKQRGGRVTASRFKAAACTNPAQPSQSLIKSICYPENQHFYTKQTSWGCVHEKTAYRAYISQRETDHTRFRYGSSGLVVHPSHPLMGASPDGIFSCECCGSGVVEIKCPYSCKDKSFLEATADSMFFLEHNDGVTSLKTDHAYFYQVQAQIKFTSTSYCDFVAWREEELFIQRIYPSEQFIASALEKVTSFIKLGVLPELLGKWYSKGPVGTSSQPPNSCSQANEWCYCKQGEEGQMIACDNKDCSIVWFHTACLGITNIPKGKWYCPDCRKIVKRGGKKDRLSMH